MSIVPLGKNVVAQRAVVEEVTEGGIIVPDSVVKDQDEATVVALGPHVYRPSRALARHVTQMDDQEPIDGLIVGDTIVIERHCGQTIVDTDGTKYVVVSEEDIIAVIRG